MGVSRGVAATPFAAGINLAWHGLFVRLIEEKFCSLKEQGRGIRAASVNFFAVHGISHKGFVEGRVRVVMVCDGMGPICTEVELMRSKRADIAGVDTEPMEEQVKIR